MRFNVTTICLVVIFITGFKESVLAQRHPGWGSVVNTTDVKVRLLLCGAGPRWTTITVRPRESFLLRFHTA